MSTSTSRSATSSSTSQRTTDQSRSAARTSRARSVHAGRATGSPPPAPAAVPAARSAGPAAGPPRRRAPARVPQACADPSQRGQRGQHQVGRPPAAPGRQHRREQQRPGHRAGRSGQVPARHDLGLPVQVGLDEPGLGQRDERAGGGVEDGERGQQHGVRARPGHREQAQHEHDAAAEDEPPPSAGLTRQDPQRKLERAAGQQRHRREQANLAVAQPEVMADQRQCRALGAVGQLVGQFNREGRRQGGEGWLSASIKTHADHATFCGSRPARPAGARTSRRRSRPP